MPYDRYIDPPFFYKTIWRIEHTNTIPSTDSVLDYFIEFSEEDNPMWNYDMKSGLPPTGAKVLTKINFGGTRSTHWNSWECSFGTITLHLENGLIYLQFDNDNNLLIGQGGYYNPNYLVKIIARKVSLSTFNSIVYLPPKKFELEESQNTDEPLIGTRWHVIYIGCDLENHDIEFYPKGKLISLIDPENDNSWSIADNILTIKINNGYSTYQGTMGKNIISGQACNIKGLKWTFRAELIIKAKSHHINNSSNKQNNVQPSQKDKSSVLSSNPKRANWNEFNKVLTDNNISTLYHFTDEANLQSIKKHDALYSWQYCESNNITIPQAGGDELSRSLDGRHGVQNYVRLSFTRNHPMMYLLQTRGRLGNTVVLEIDPVVVFWKDTKFADKNATRNDVNIGSTLDDFKRIRFNIIKQQNHFDLSEEEKPFYQAEVLVFEKIPIEFIKNINNL